MSNKTTIELSSSGVRALLQSSEMMDVVEGIANDALTRLGAGYEVSTRTGKTRVNASIAAVTREAKLENLEENTVLKALK